MKPMLAVEPSDKHPVRFPTTASLKLDGIRCLIPESTALTRSLKPIPNAHMSNLLSNCAYSDGEIIVGDPADPDCYRKTNSAVMRRSGEPEFNYYIFDNLLEPRWPHRQRLIKAAMWQHLPYVKVLPHYEIADQQGLDAFYIKTLAEGHEGVMLRDPNSAYKFGRSTAQEQGLLKMKPFKDSEAEVLSVYEAKHNTNEAVTNELGRTQRSSHASGLVGNGMLGGFSCRDLATGAVFDCAPGKLSHPERILMWATRDALTGSTIKYRYFDYGLKDGTPRFPRYIGERNASDMST